MRTIPRKYIVDESNKKIAVQLDIEEFEKLEGLIADYALGQILSKEEDVEELELKDAKSFYQKLDKKD